MTYRLMGHLGLLQGELYDMLEIIIMLSLVYS
jgi:hypothetical protein